MAAFAATLAAATTTIGVGEYCRYIFFKSPSRFGDVKRKKMINAIIRAGDSECIAQLRINKAIFCNLCSVLRDRNLLSDGKHVSMEEQLVMFLHTIGHNVKNRVIGHRFIRSREIVSRYFSKAVDAIIELYREFVTLLSADTLNEILSNPKWSTYFQGCIGAIDGTHIPAHVPALKSATYRNRKGFLSQNVMGACKYYIVDAGYAHALGFMAPYCGVWYHLNEYRMGRVLSNMKELFNYRAGLVEDEVSSTDVTESIDLSPCSINVTQREKDEWATFRDNIAMRMWNESLPIIEVNSDEEMSPKALNNQSTPTKQPGQEQSVTLRRTP
ncbi:uncharacterized protein LOC131233746 [Magnolia sinica]|uniref:uncharacterized protein LOC131233746 n=1 Tax=Magnolia sinica TaxID=86752 RepID=UPI002659B84D|nr:uncharacterized protein LOC131233746 [Magnolia sinica]